ncbi:hypothetical protein CWO84_14230 [Methylomonas sp. Kb3]|uniref:helix-turn-helix transcriptional regulator n=1 Tax=Methylomonas sp. Kb3 TaxID=1611544 RepID=UPI000C32D147|nr:hypothetical protein [Methylomonas sp. Kb3]PKD39614.1 hypothetical protein CWO84_14230 [Methylomonas sp. Kb3]
MNNKLTLDKSALAEELSISVRTLERMIKDGDVPPPSSKIPKIAWPTAVIEKWLLEEYNLTDETTKVEKKRGRKRLAI